MKNIFFFFFLILLSCGNEKEELLVQKLVVLKKENQQLKDSITSLKNNSLTSSKLIVIPEESELTIGKKNKMIGFIFEYKKVRPYKLLKLENYDFNNELEMNASPTLVSKNNTKSFFDYNFTPKSPSDSILNLLVKFDFKEGNKIKSIEMSYKGFFKLKVK